MTNSQAAPLAPAQVAEGYAAACLYHNVPARLPAEELRTCWFTVVNQGSQAWPQGAVKLAISLSGVPIAQLELPHAVSPGARATLHWTCRVPKEVGPYEFQLDLTAPDAPAPGQPGVPLLRVPFEVVKGPVTSAHRLREVAFERNAWYWIPCEGISWSSTGPGYPLFARAAQGCRITDQDGRQYLDYSMGWGCALLGYAHERIRRALADALGFGAVLPLAHLLELEVTEMLCQMFPGAEAVSFGKHGSDACTVAVRLARAHTGRPIVLVCGYHGWHDWYVGPVGLAVAGVPVRGDPLVFPYEYGNLEQLAALLEVHRGQVAAVMVEPAGCDTPAGPNQDADPAFLRELTALARREGALVIFDEIFTAFRYPGGSVQQAVGVVPDLTCLGKALSAGMPLSALVGRKDVFYSSIGRIFYGPTFRGEAYSFAAARAALAIYRDEDVAARVWSFGSRLKAALNQLCDKLHVPAEIYGFPVRMVLGFKDTDQRRVTLMRTLLHQELCKQGILSWQNGLVPSAAHDEAALAETCRAFEHALGVVMEALEDDRFASYLEIPPVLWYWPAKEQASEGAS